MTYTFTEDEINIFLGWAVYAEGEKPSLSAEEKDLIKRLNKIVTPTFDELSNEEKVYKFCREGRYPISWYSPAYCEGDPNNYFVLEREGKEEKRIPTTTDYKKVIKEIVNYYED